MSRTLYGKTSWGLLKLDLNIFEGDCLSWLLWGLQEKIGVSAPMSMEDCKIVARILRNKARNLENLSRDDKHTIQDHFSLFMTRNGKRDYLTSPGTITWIRDTAEFFEKIDGLIEGRE